MSIQVLDLISSDNLNVPSEEEVYRAVLSWVKHDIDGRRQHVPWVRLCSPVRSSQHCSLFASVKPFMLFLLTITHSHTPPCFQLMKCVRLPLLRRDFLMSNVDTELLVRHHSECKDLLIEALKYHLMPEQRGVLSNSRTRPRRCEGASPVLFAVGQCAPEGTHQGTLRTHLSHAQLTFLKSKDCLIKFVWCCVFGSGGGSLFAIHGDCEAYDTRTDRWHMVASMSTRRARVGVAAIGNRLYAVGG